MRLRKALGISRVFVYQGNKYFALLYLKQEFWPKHSFVVHCCDAVNPNGGYEFSSHINVKPVIRMKTPPSSNCSSQ